MKRLNPEVYVADQPILAIGESELVFLQNNVDATARKRTRLCVHQDSEEPLHEMFVTYTSKTYMRPNRHPKDESLHLLEGNADLILFDESGGVTEIVQLNGDPASGSPFYCRIPQGIYHTMLMRSDHLVIHEGITGPFRPGTTTVFAPWSPPEDDAPGITAFMGRIEAEFARRIADQRAGTLRVKAQSPEVLVSDEVVGKFGLRERDLLRDALQKTSRGRVRICMHQQPDERLHEMFIMFAKGTYLPASKHLGNDESVDVIEGVADCVLFDESGGITEVISVGDRSTGLPFYFRTPHERYHAWIIRTDTWLVHEMTLGPFSPESTILAPWSPGNLNDTAEVPRYQAQLEEQTARFREMQRV